MTHDEREDPKSKKLNRTDYMENLIKKELAWGKKMLK